MSRVVRSNKRIQEIRKYIIPNKNGLRVCVSGRDFGSSDSEGVCLYLTMLIRRKVVIIYFTQGIIKYTKYKLKFKLCLSLAP